MIEKDFQCQHLVFTGTFGMQARGGLRCLLPALRPITQKSDRVLIVLLFLGRAIQGILL